MRSIEDWRNRRIHKPMSNVLSHTFKICQMEKVRDFSEQLTRSKIKYFAERGKFLALDLGGTNFRVLLIHLKGESDFEMQSKIYAIPQSIMIGSGSQLFDHIAECLANFIKVRINLRFTIDFQLNLSAGFRNTNFNTRGCLWASPSPSHWNN